MNLFLSVLDEATSQIGEDMETKLYSMCSVHDITLLSVGHRASLRQYHHKELHIYGQAEGGRWTLTNLHHHQGSAQDPQGASGGQQHHQQGHGQQQQQQQQQQAEQPHSSPQQQQQQQQQPLLLEIEPATPSKTTDEYV